MTTDAETIDVDATEEASTELVVTQRREVVQVTADMLLERRAGVLDFMSKAMVQGIDADYAKLPGCGPKPVLLQPGADKLRLYLGIDATSERTFFENEGDGRFRVAYRTTAVDQWGVRLSKERWAAHSDEGKKFFDNCNKPLPLNTLASRAEKRSYVAAIAAFTGVREVFGSGEASELISDTAGALVIALYQAAGLDRLAKQAGTQAKRVKLLQWPTWLGAAVDTVGDVREWSQDQREALYQALLPASVSVTDLPALLDASEGSL